FTLEKFQEILSKKNKSPIGLILMDQSLLSGIGNIYRSEILFQAGVMPERKAESLSKAEIGKIFESSRKILEKAIKLRGTSDSDYRDTDGAPGGFQKILKVYNRESEKCQKCGTIISRGKMGQRSIFFCSKCQK
ncbi:MAG: Fpg/Nei family DNA glycosylase, partial [Patescibacteria group bacterium]